MYIHVLRCTCICMYVHEHTSEHLKTCMYMYIQTSEGMYMYLLDITKQQCCIEWFVSGLYNYVHWLWLIT